MLEIVNEVIEKKGTKLGYRPEVKIVDCTIRDGGLINSFFFEDKFVKELYDASSNAGIDYLEIGYKASKKIFAPSKFGKWKFCEENDLRDIVGENKSQLKLSVMADAGRTDYHTDILHKDESVVDMVRVATYIHQIPAAIEIIKDAHDKGYETTLNLMAVSLVKEEEISEALELICKTDVDVIYLVDSFGSFYSEEIRELSRKYLAIAEANKKAVGIHAHNNQQLAYANTIEAMILGVSYLDTTVSGLGRGAGNCPTELMMGFLKNPKFYRRPLIEFIQKNIVPLRKNLTWGYDIPYMLTGQLNQHPKAAMDFLKDNVNPDYVEFFDKLVEDN